MSPPGRPKGEYRSAEHEGIPVRAAGEAQARRARRRAIAHLAEMPTCDGAVNANEAKA
jgi:hypothetical protein